MLEVMVIYFCVQKKKENFINKRYFIFNLIEIKYFVFLKVWLKIEIYWYRIFSVEIQFYSWSSKWLEKSLEHCVENKLLHWSPCYVLITEFIKIWYLREKTKVNAKYCVSQS